MAASEDIMFLFTDSTAKKKTTKQKTHTYFRYIFYTNTSFWF